MKLLRSLTVSLSLTVPLTAFSQPNGDMLKQTFAKIAFAHQVRTIHRLAMQDFKNSNKVTAEVLTQRLQGEQLDFNVKVIASGPVSEIADRKMTDLVTDLNGRRLNVSVAGFSTTVNNITTDETQADVQWDEGGYSPTDEMSKYTLRQALALAGFADNQSCRSYIRASIGATFKQQSGQWDALYLVDCASGKIHAIDLVMWSAVEQFWDTNVYPSSLLNLHFFAKNEAVQAWLRNNASSTCATNTACFENGKITIPQVDLAEMPALTGEVLAPTTTGNQCVRHQADCSEERVNVDA